MSGLDKIISEIRDEAAAEAKQAVDAAKAEAAKIIAEATEENSKLTNKIMLAAQQEVADIERRLESAIALQRRQRSLAQKQVLLSETLQKAQTVLSELPDELYFSLLARLAKNAAQVGSGVMMLGEADKGRVPQNFAAMLKDVLPQNSSLEISDETHPISGGFVLKYGDVEENCSVQAIFNAREDEFSDLIRDTLFA